MVTPDFDTFTALAGQGNIVPIYREIMGDLETPVLAYKKLGRESMSFLLESVEGGEKWGRYSFLGLHPSLVVKVRGNVVVVSDNKGEEKYENVLDPFEIIRQVLGRYKAVSLPDLPRFYGGLVGYFSYDMVRLH